MNKSNSPWVTVVLWTAAIYNTIFGLWLAMADPASLAGKRQYLIAGVHLIFSIVFLLSVRSGYIRARARKTIACPEIQKIALRKRTNFGLSIDELSRQSAVLLVFLHHANFPFCEEAVADLAANRFVLEANDVLIVLVHMNADWEVASLLLKYGLNRLHRIRDPRRSLYRAFGLRRATFREILNPKLWWHRQLTGDRFQMPGAFLIFFGEIIRSHVHQHLSDHSNYQELALDGSFPHTETTA